MKRIRLFMLLIFLMTLILPVRAEEDRLSVTVPKGKVKGFIGTQFTVEAPDDGILEITIGEGENTWRRIRTEVSPGENIIAWDGLGENREVLRNGQYTVNFSLSLTNGREYTYTGEVMVKGTAAGLKYALPSCDILYTDGSERWFMEYCLAGSGTFVMEVRDGDETVYSIAVPVRDDKCHARNWDGTDLNGQPLAPGTYTVICRSEDFPEDTVRSELTVRETCETDPMTVTGNIMPDRTMTDNEIWQLMMMPSVVSTEGILGHQEVYDRPSKEGKILGTLHGQSQGVEVLEIREDGWTLVRAWTHEDGVQVTGYVPSDKLTVVRPNGRYGLLVDKREQTLTLYKNGEAVATIPVSTGLVTKEKLIRETAAGTFLTDEHEGGFSSEGYHYDYPLRYDGGNLLHQIGYTMKKQRKVFSDQVVHLGEKASHGCVRLPMEPDPENGLNAYWFWTHLPFRTRVIILDDPQERTAEAALYANATVTDRLALRLMTTQSGAPEEAYIPGEEETEIILTIGGDAVLGTRKEWRKDEDAFPAYILKYGYDYPFSGLKDLFENDDMTFINLECALKNNDEGEKTGKLYRFRGPTEYTEILKKCSIEQVNIANNHYVDYQEKGKVSTKNALRDAGIPFSGYSQLYVWEVKGHKIGFAGVREQIYNQRPEIIAEETRKLRDLGCEVVIYSCHWGTEYSPEHNEKQIEMASACAYAGVDIVIGTHPHVVQGVDRVGDTVVLWSLGNLCFGGTKELTTYDATLAQLGLIFDENGYKGVNLSLIPVQTSGRAAEGINDYRPVTAEGEDRERILQLIRSDSAYDPTGDRFYPTKK